MEAAFRRADANLEAYREKEARHVVLILWQVCRDADAGDMPIGAPEENPKEPDNKDTGIRNWSSRAKKLRTYDVQSPKLKAAEVVQ